MDTPFDGSMLGGMSIEQFCRLFGIGRTKYFELRLAGLGPDVLPLGRRRVISYAAALRWQSEREVRCDQHIIDDLKNDQDGDDDQD